MAASQPFANPPPSEEASHVWKAGISATSHSLLIRAQHGEREAWQDLSALYRPLIAGWLKYQAIPAQDVDDTVQEILMAVVKNLGTFAHSGRRGAFRAWLRSITFSEISNYWRRRRHLALPASDLAAAEQALMRLQDTHDVLARIWDQEHDRYVLRSLIQSLESEFAPETVKVFRRVALDGVPASHVADELGLNIGAVYTTKSRVLRRLREVAQELIDGFQ